MFEEAEKYAAELVKRKHIPYLDILTYQDHKPVWRWYGGDGREPVEGNEKLFMYSATKPMTAACALRLCEEGKLSLYDEVERWLPAYRHVFLLNEKGEKCPPRTKMLVLHLLTMTAGLTYDIARYPIKERILQNGGSASTEMIASALAEAPLLFNPGERFNYSLCHDVLAAVIEKAAGKPFSAYMKETIFSPLGMQNSYFSKSTEGIANQYRCTENGDVQKTDIDTGLIFCEGYESGGAGVISCVEDYIRFADALACGGTAQGYQLLKPETVDQMRREALPSITVHNGFTCVQGEDYGYGLGVRTRMKPTSWGLPQGEFGWDGAAGSYVMVDPVNHISVFMGMHLHAWPRIFAGEHLQIVEQIYRQMLG